MRSSRARSLQVVEKWPEKCWGGRKASNEPSPRITVTNCRQTVKMFSYSMTNFSSVSPTSHLSICLLLWSSIRKFVDEVNHFKSEEPLDSLSISGNTQIPISQIADICHKQKRILLINSPGCRENLGQECLPFSLRQDIIRDKDHIHLLNKHSFKIPI